MNRRSFLACAGAAAMPPQRTVRLGMVGLGGRGTSLLKTVLAVGGAEVRAVCDIDAPKLERAAAAVASAGQPQPPERYARGDEDYKRLMSRDDLDAVIIATPWEWHTPMAVFAMKARKYAAVEVPAAITLEQCWELVNTHEQTGVPCMMLENWSFRSDNLAVLKMARAGLFGDIVHCHCAHSHNCIYWYFDEPSGAPRWSGQYLLKRNADQYPTHSLGPVLSWLDINCGDTYQYLTSTATASLGINRSFARKLGPDHPAAKRRYLQGDIVTTVIRTNRGRTIVINNDMQLPRPYDNRWMLQGTLGVYSEDRSAVYLSGKSPEYEQWEPFGPWGEKFAHSWWRNATAEAVQLGHGGTDHIELREFLRAVRNREQTPIDIYDSVMMSVIVPLSEQSIAKGSAPVECPDFTRGKWKTRKPAFGLES